MSFKQFGGLNYAAKNNIIGNLYSTSGNLGITSSLGQDNSKIVCQSHLDLSGNSLLHVGNIYFMDGSSLPGSSSGPAIFNNGITVQNGTITDTLFVSSGTTINGSVIIGNSLQVNNNNIIIEGTPDINYIQFPDGSKQYQAISSISPSPAGTYTNLNATINDLGQITTASNGTSMSTITIQSNEQGTNTWSFDISNNYGRAFTYCVYSDTNATNYDGAPQSSSTPPYSYSYDISLNGSFFFGTGSAVSQPYQRTSALFDDSLCTMYPSLDTITASGTGYVMNPVNSMGGNLSWVITSTNSVGWTCQTDPVPKPVPNGNFTTNYTLNFDGNVSTCNAILVITIVAP